MLAGEMCGFVLGKIDLDLMEPPMFMTQQIGFSVHINALKKIFFEDLLENFIMVLKQNLRNC